MSAAPDITDADLRRAAERVLYPIPDAARVMGVSRSTLYDLMTTGELASVTIGRRRLIPRAAIEGFVAARLAESAPRSSPPAVMEPFLTVEQVRQLLNVSEATARHIIGRNGGVTAYRICPHGVLRVRPADLERWLSMRLVGGPFNDRDPRCPWPAPYPSRRPR